VKVKIEAKKSYSIYIERELSQLDLSPNTYSHIVVIGDNNVIALYLAKIKKNISFPVHYIQFPAGEHHKTRETKAFIEDELFKLGCGRDTLLIALGGGVVLDLVGFIAATFCRGVDVIYLPTSLLAMVDASIGGKTAVNTPYGKNLIGCFSSPAKVWIDVNFLKTLPLRECRSGMAEVLKHAIIADLDFLNWLKVNQCQIQQQNSLLLEEMIYKSTMIKKNIVEQDEHESGQREILNFGHTVGHVFELLSNFNMTHGEAVSLGMLMESFISYLMGILEYKDFLVIQSLLKSFELPIKLNFVVDFESFLHTMYMDKKVKKNKIHMVLLKKLGCVYHQENQYSLPISSEIIKQAFNQFFI